MVNPGGTGRPRDAISARLAPLPPRRSFISFDPSESLPPNPYTYFFAFTAIPIPPCQQLRCAGASLFFFFFFSFYCLLFPTTCAQIPYSEYRAAPADRFWDFLIKAVEYLEYLPFLFMLIQPHDGE